MILSLKQNIFWYILIYIILKATLGMGVISRILQIPKHILKVKPKCREANCKQKYYDPLIVYSLH